MEDLKELLESIGYNNLKENNEFYVTNAVYRNGDNPTALNIHKYDGWAKDFVTGDAFSLKTLISLTLKLSDEDLNKYLKNKSVDLSLIVDNPNYQPPKITMEKTWQESSLRVLLPHYKFYQDKGISIDTLKLFRSGLCTSEEMNGRYTFPIFNKDGLIHGWSGRDISGKKESKWKHLGAKRNWVYPAYMHKMINNKKVYPCLDAIKKEKNVIIVESIGDMLWLWEHEVYNVLVSFGLTIGSKFKSFLISLDLDYVDIATNNDFDKEINRGKNAALLLYIQLMTSVDFRKLRISLPVDCNDFGECTEEKLKKWNEFRKSYDPQLYYKDIMNKLSELYKSKKITKAQLSMGLSLKEEYGKK